MRAFPQPACASRRGPRLRRAAVDRSFAFPHTPVAASGAPQRTVGPFPAFDQEQVGQALFDLGQHGRPVSGAVDRFEDGELGGREDNCLRHVQSVTPGRAGRLSKIGRFAIDRYPSTAIFLRSISLKSMAAPRPGPLGTCTRPSRPTTISCSRPYFCAPSGSRTSKKVVLRIEAMTWRLATLLSELPP